MMAEWNKIKAELRKIDIGGEAASDWEPNEKQKYFNTIREFVAQEKKRKKT